MANTLPGLPYPKGALAPHISERSLDFYHGKHHNTDVVNIDKLTEGRDLANESLENTVKMTAGDSADTGLCNNAAQVWNRTFNPYHLEVNKKNNNVGCY